MLLLKINRRNTCCKVFCNCCRIQEEFGIGNAEREEMTQQYVDMTSNQIRGIFNVPKYENLEQFADNMLDEEEKRLRLIEASQKLEDQREKDVLKDSTDVNGVRKDCSGTTTDNSEFSNLTVSVEQVEGEGVDNLDDGLHVEEQGEGDANPDDLQHVEEHPVVKVDTVSGQRSAVDGQRSADSGKSFKDPGQVVVEQGISDNVARGNNNKAGVDGGLEFSEPEVKKR